MIIFILLFFFSTFAYSDSTSLWYNSISSLTDQYPPDGLVMDPNKRGRGWFQKLYGTWNSRYPDPGECDATIMPYYGCVGEGTIDSKFKNIINIDKPCNFFDSSLSSKDICRALEWFHPSDYSNFTFTRYYGEWYADYNIVYYPTPFCPDNSRSKLSDYYYRAYMYVIPNSECISRYGNDYRSMYMDSDMKDPLVYEQGGYNCNSRVLSYGYQMAFCPAPAKLQKSEQTAIKTNSLIAESNSKVGLVASVNTTNTNLLALIYSKLDSIFKTGQGLAISKKKPPVEKSPFLDSTSTDSSVINDLSQNETDVRVSIDSSKNSACPAPISFNAFNQSQSISYQPLCNFATRSRSMVIAAARVASACIIMGIL